MKTIKYALAVALSLIALIAPKVVRADSLTVTFDIPSVSFPPPGSAPWATLTLSLTATQTIDANLQMSPGLITNFLCFDIPGSVSGFAVAGLPSGWQGVANVGFACANSFGSSNAFILDSANIGDPASNAQSALNLILSRTGGFSSVNDIVGTSAYGLTSQFPFFITVASCGPSGCVGGGAAAVVSEPSTLLLLGSGLLGFGALIRRRFGVPLFQRCPFWR